MRLKWVSKKCFIYCVCLFFRLRYKYMKNKTEKDLIYEHFSELGKKSWEVRKKKILEKLKVANKQKNDKL